MNIKRGVAICHYNRLEHLTEVIENVKYTVPNKTRIVVCDDGSDQILNVEDINLGFNVADICRKNKTLLIKGPNFGVAANKNRALWALQDCHFICILEDDLMPKEEGWFEAYEKAAQLANCHHFCRIQDKEIPETIPEFSEFLRKNGVDPIFASSPRGDLTFLTREVVRKVGAFNPKFRGAGYAHGEWSQRVANAGLIGHPLKWIDIVQGRNKFVQIGDCEGGRWKESQLEINRQLKRNSKLMQELAQNPYIHHPLVLE